MEPEGLRYQAGFLDVVEQRRLLARLEAIPPESWERVRFRGNVARRRKISFGVNYQPDSREIRPAPPLPDFLRELRDRAAAAFGLPAEPFAQASVQWYPAGAGIGAHRDAPMFGPDVLGVSLGAEGRLIFKRGTSKHELLLAPGSLVLLSGPARSQWTHEMPGVKAPRYSIYFRTLRP
jgi:alkylated DNA repair protein (DNA oxidative demethylase)